MPREFFRTLVDLRDKEATLTAPYAQQGVQVRASVFLEQRFLRFEDGSTQDAGTFRPSGTIKADHGLLMRLLNDEAVSRLAIPGEPEIGVEVYEIPSVPFGRKQAEGRIHLTDVEDLLNKYLGRRPGQ